MRRMPPNKIEQNLSGLTTLVPDATDELLQRVDQPLEEATCAVSSELSFILIVVVVGQW